MSDFFSCRFHISFFSLPLFLFLTAPSPLPFFASPSFCSLGPFPSPRHCLFCRLSSFFFLFFFAFSFAPFCFLFVLFFSHLYFLLSLLSLFPLLLYFSSVFSPPPPAPFPSHPSPLPAPRAPLFPLRFVSTSFIYLTIFFPFFFVVVFARSQVPSSPSALVFAKQRRSCGSPLASIPPPRPPRPTAPLAYVHSAIQPQRWKTIKYLKHITQLSPDHV